MIESDPAFEFSAMSSGARDLPQFMTVWSLTTILRCLSPFVEIAERSAASRLNLSQVKKMAKAWSDSSMPFSPRPIVVAVQAPIDFTTLGENPNSCVGTLRLRSQAILGVCDGLHRIAALAASKVPLHEFKEATWPVQFIPVRDGCEFEKINRHFNIERSPRTPRTSKAKLLRDLRDSWTHEVIASSAFLTSVIARGKSSLSRRSAKLWTESAVVRAIRLHTPKGEDLLSSDSAVGFSRFWNGLPAAVPVLGDYLNGKLRAADLRADSVLGSTAILAPLAQLGSAVADLGASELTNVLSPLSSLDWAAANPQWHTEGSKAERERLWAQRLMEICNLSKSGAFPNSTNTDHAP